MQKQKVIVTASITILSWVDMSYVQCVVGWVEDGNEWAIVDRSSDQAHPKLLPLKNLKTAFGDILLVPIEPH
jgi:hypothetical protein